MTHHIALDSLTLDHGSHSTRDDGVCLLEAVAWWAHEDHTDHPACVSRVLGAFGRAWNDALPPDERQQLVRYVPLLPGTAGDAEADERRAWMATDWLVRVHTPAWLRLAGLDAHADALEGLPELAAGWQVPSIKPVLEAARRDASAAGAAARDAAGDAAGAAAWDAAGDAAGAAAWDAAWDAAGDAAGAAAWDAAGAAAWDAARAAAWAAAWDAAGDAAGAAAWDAAGDAARAAAWDAAWDAAGDAAGAAAWDAARAAAGAAARAALKPTRDRLIEAAHELFESMIEVRVAVDA